MNSTPENQTKTDGCGSLPLATGSALLSVAEARQQRLNRGLLTLASWCKSRAMFHHNEKTTATMLRRKVDELFDAVDKAGWAAQAKLQGDDDLALVFVEDASDLMRAAAEEYRRLSALPNQ